MKETKEELPCIVGYSDIQTRLKIRTACSDDAAVIAKILTETFADYKSLYTLSALAAMTPSETEIVRRFGEAGEIWVAAFESEIVGTISVVHHRESLYIRSLAILPAAQGLRIGEGLFGGDRKICDC